MVSDGAQREKKNSKSLLIRKQRIMCVFFCHSNVHCDEQIYTIWCIIMWGTKLATIRFNEMNEVLIWLHNYAM